jgi:DNA polymerase-3 subunit beta
VIKGSITVRPQAFAAAVKWAAKFVATKPATPVQAGLALDIADDGLHITAYSESITARARVGIEGNGEGRAIVSGRLLAELAGTFPDKPVTIAGDNGDEVTITVGRWRGTLPAMDESDWPELPVPPERIGEVGGEAFAAAVADVAVAAKKDGKAPFNLACIHLTFGENSVVAIATDAHRAARSAVPFAAAGKDGGTLTALVSANAMTDVAGAFTGPDAIEIGLGPNVMSLTSDTRAVVLRQSADKYDDAAIDRFFKLAGSHPEHAQIAREELLQPMKRAAIIREKDGPIKVGFGANLITLAAAAEDVKRDSDEEIEAIYAGPDHTLNFNPKYFAEAVATAPGDTVDICMTTERVTGVLLTVPGNDTWQHVLMPLRGR